MKVAELMQTDVRVARLDWTLSDVVESLADGHVTGLPVVDRHGHLLGVVSTADVLQAQAEAPSDEGDTWRDTRVAEVMSRPVHTIAPDAEIRSAAQQMLYGDVHRLFVEWHGKLVGVVSQTDLVRALAGHPA
jgi:CBS-domain-containing membrane protein